MDASSTQNPDSPAEKRICDCCVGESYLKGLMGSGGTTGICSYCEEESKTFTINQLADLIETAFDAHYERTPTEPEGFEATMHYDRESNYTWRRRGQEVLWAISDAAEIDEAAAGDVLSVLQDRHFDHEKAKMGDESEFDSDSHYARKDPGCDELSERWREFENSLKTEARFFSRSAQGTLDDIFADLADLRTSEGKPVLVTVGPEEEIKFAHRARVFAAEDEKLAEALKFPWKHLGPPPMQAASAGRMNALGIAVFYGAFEPTTALAEVRPPVGSKAVVSKFIFERRLRLLDVEALKSVAIAGSIFDPKHLGQLQRARFLEILSARISQPVMPNEEAFEYLATQAVADYLATEASLDGIIFPSVQVGHASSNVVLFHHASRVAEVQIPNGTEVTAILEQRDSDGVTPDYEVWEEVPSPSPENAASEPDLMSLAKKFWQEQFPEFCDKRQPSLKIDLASITVHHVTAASFTTEEYPVGRHQTVQPPKDGPFNAPQQNIFE
ncbi:MAG TPA: RES domain-containing protein [Terriglobia bacterium]|nr:RES domain-containing protein [Terriglobia bacterium]